MQTVNLNSHGVRPADVVIEPDVMNFDLTEFTRTDELAEAGVALPNKLFRKSSGCSRNSTIVCFRVSRLRNVRIRWHPYFF